MRKALGIALLVIIAIVAVAYAYAHRSRSAPAGEEARLFLGGDVHFGAHAPKLGNVGVLLKPAFGIVNLEGPTGTSEAAASSRQERLVNAREGLAALAAEGVRVVGIANNHARDISPNETAHDARAALLLPTGAEEPAVIETPAGRVIVTAHELGSISDVELKRQLTEARARGSFMVSTFHVTAPPLYLPRPELRSAVETALAAGADVVAAHGTHAIGPVERRGKAAIVWGLGNLLFACDCSREREGAVLEITFTRNAPPGAAIIPILAGLDGEAAQLDPAADLVFDLLKALGSSPIERTGPRGAF